MTSGASLKVLTPGREYTAEMPGTGSLRSGVPHSAGTPFKEPSSYKDKHSHGSPSLDSIQRNRNKSCGRWSLQGRVQEKGKDHFHYVRLGCKRWDCPRCGPRKARRVRKAIIDRASALNLRRFLTLTLDPRKCTASESATYIKKCWTKFRTYLKRKHGHVTFIAIIEFQKNGYAHYHILVSHYLRQEWVSQAWQAVGGGRIVNVKQVDIQRVAPYVSKYLSKELLIGGFRRKQRRYTTSRDVSLFVKQPSGKWKLLKVPIELLLLLAPVFGPEERDEDGSLRGFKTFQEIILPI